MDSGTVAVTGATGFIGKHLVKALLETGHTVLALHRRRSTNMPNPGAQLLWIPIDEAAAGFRRHRPDAVVHLATCYGADSTLAEIVESNVVMPLRLLELAAAQDCSYFINTDSYFAKPEFDYSHMRPYIGSKNEFMRWATLATERVDGLKVVNARLEHVYGPGDGDQKFITQILKKLLANEPVPLTPGAQLRDFIHVRDVVAGYLALLKAPQFFSTGTTEVQVGTGTARSVREFVETAKALSNSASPLSFGALPYRDQEIMQSVAVPACLEHLGWRAQLDIAAGLQDTIESMRQKNGMFNTARASAER